MVIGLTILITCNVFLSSSSLTSMTPSNLETRLNPYSSSSGTGLSPFFTHVEEDKEQYLQLNNTVDGYDADFFHHAFTSSSGFTITDYTQYADDLIYFLMGFADSDVNFDQLDYTGTPLWDSTNQGFFKEMDGTLTTVSTEKKVFDNLLYILALLKGTEYASNPTSVVNKITSQWSAVINEFWDNDNSAFNHSNAASNERFSNDNLLGAYIALSLSKSSSFTQSFRNQVLATGTALMTGFASTMYDDTYDSFYNTSDLSNLQSSTFKYLYSNALGILALLEWNIANGYEYNSTEVQQAEDTWRFINDKFYNSTFDLYMTRSSETGLISDQNLYLLENAWMLQATLELFKHTGNTTYYIHAMDLFNGIEATLYQDSGYNSQYGSNEKTMDSYGMFLYSLNNFYDIYLHSEITVVLNQSEYVYQIDPTLNFTLSYNISMDFSYSAIGESWSISAPIDNADIDYILRYAENNTIVNVNSSTTDASGQHLFLYNLSTLTSLYDYELGILCNRTGFNVDTEIVDLPLTAGFEIDEISPLYDILHQGETGLLNITYTSSRPDNIDAVTITSGEYFLEQTSSHHIIAREDEIDGKIKSSIVVNVTALEDAELGSQFLKIIVLNNFSEPIFQQKIDLEIFSAVEVLSILVDQYLVDLAPTEMEFTFKNHRKTNNESINIEVNGSTFVYSNTIVDDIPALGQKSKSVSLVPNAFVKMGELEFLITIKRNSTIIFNQTFSILGVPEIDIISINPSNILLLQGQAPKATVRVYNYNNSAKQLYAFSNGIQVLDSTIATGESIITVELGRPVRNPYNIGEEQYEIVIKNEMDTTLASRVIMVDIKPSTLNIFLFYVVPTLIPIGAIIFFKYKEIEQEKRLK